MYNGETGIFAISKIPNSQLAIDSLELLVEKLESRTESAMLHGNLKPSCIASARLQNAT